MTLNRRGKALVYGWLVFGFILLNVAINVNDFVVLCDWRHGYEPCYVGSAPWHK